MFEMIEEFCSNTKSLKSEKKNLSGCLQIKKIVNFTYSVVKTHFDEYPFHQ